MYNNYHCEMAVKEQLYNALGNYVYLVTAHPIQYCIDLFTEKKGDTSKHSFRDAEAGTFVPLSKNMFVLLKFGLC